MHMIDVTTAQKIIKVIIEHQQAIIGPVALSQANKVTGLAISDTGTVSVKDKNPESAVNDLVHRYEDLFGQASVEVCKDAIREIHPPIPSDELPQVLR